MPGGAQPDVDTVPLTSPWNIIDWNVTQRKVRQIQTRIVKYLKHEYVSSVGAAKCLICA